MRTEEEDRARGKLAPIHAVVKKYTNYCRVYSNKRQTDLNASRVHEHHIKYYGCYPTDHQLCAINCELAPMKLKAYRICPNDWGGRPGTGSIEIRTI